MLAVLIKFKTNAGRNFQLWVNLNHVCGVRETNSHSGSLEGTIQTGIIVIFPGQEVFIPDWQMNDWQEFIRKALMTMQLTGGRQS